MQKVDINNWTQVAVSEIVATSGKYRNISIQKNVVFHLKTLN